MNISTEQVAWIPPYVSVRVRMESDEGAHPNVSTQHFLWDTSVGRTVMFTEVVSDTVFTVIAGMCWEELIRQSKDEGWEPFADLMTNIKLTLAKPTSWCFREQCLTIQFDAYSVAAYVFGPRQVDIPYNTIQQWLSDDFKRALGEEGCPGTTT